MTRPVRAIAPALWLVLSAIPALAQPTDSPWSVTRIGLVYQAPAMANVAVTEGIEYQQVEGTPRTFDMYAPPGPATAPRPAVIFVNGVGDVGDNPPRRWAIYRDWARAVATEGMVGINYGVTSDRLEAGLLDLFAWLEENGAPLGIDASRIGIYASSANVGVGLPFAMRSAPPALRCAVFYYGGVPVDSLRPDLPVLYVKTQKDNPNLNRTVDALWERARTGNLPWTMVVGRGLPHAFDGLDTSEASRAIIRQTLDFWRTHLQPLPSAPAATAARELNRLLYGQEHAEAARFLERETARDTSDFEAHRLLLQSYRNLNDVERGIPFAEKLIQRWPDVSSVRTSYGMLLASAGRQADALRELETSARLGAQDFNTYFQLMLAALNNNRPDLAVQYGSRAVEIFPTQGVAHYNLACAHVRNGDPEAAISSLEAAVRNGFRDRATFDSDPDMAPLRQDPRYQALMAGLQP